MKTPREILLQKHRSAEPLLDDVREQALATLHPKRSEPAQPRWTVLLGELFAVPRFAWGGFAAAWMVIAALNFAVNHNEQRAPMLVTERTPESQQALAEQRRLFVELVRSGNSAEAPAFVPRPRSHHENETHRA